MKIVHCGDFHFNRPQSSLDSEKLSAIRRREHFDAFIKTAELAKEADALLISGDLFDNRYFDSGLTEKICGLLKNIRRVFISPGNHDPYSSTSVYERFPFPENVHIFKGETEEVDCGEFSVYGNKGTEIGDISLDKSRINILCIHADVNGNGEYNSISENTLCSYGFDYVALGHIHKYSGIIKKNSTFYAYPGVPFSGGFDERGECGVLVGEIEKDRCDLERVVTDNRQFHALDIKLTEANGYEDIVLPEINPSDFYKITLTGTIAPDFILRADVFKEKIRDKFYFVKVRNETRVHIPYEEMAEEYSLKGIFVSKMLEKIKADPKNTLLCDALDAGLRILDGRKAEEVL